MPGRDRVPSFKLATGTTNERDYSYNLNTLGSIFYNTDTSNVEVYHEDPSNTVGWRDLVMNNKEQIDISGKLVVKDDVSFNAHLSVLDASFQNNVEIERNLIVRGDISATNVVADDISGVNKITFTDGSDISSNKFMGFRCRQTTDQSVVENTLLYYNTTDVDTESKVTQVTSGTLQTKYTIPKKGWWLFSISGSSHNSHISPEIQINGADGQLRGSSSSSAFYQAITMGMLECEVDDVITIINKHASSAVYRTAEAYPQFQGWFVGNS